MNWTNRKHRFRAGWMHLLVALTLLCPLASAAFVPVSGVDWDETAVRRVMHIFAYGGFATDQQIATWSNMDPQDAIQEMLTFDVANPQLAPVDAADVDGMPPPSFPLSQRNYRGDLEEISHGSLRHLQEFWNSTVAENPVREDKRHLYDTVYPRTLLDGSIEYRLDRVGVQYAWMGAVTRRGLNPFLHKTLFWATNYNMAVSLDAARAPLIRGMYDDLLEALQQDRPYDEVLATGASSAAIAFQYGHRNNRYIRSTGEFKGNDDFARELLQLFFVIQGDTENDQATNPPWYTGTSYHEDVSIENTALLLTGMKLDKMPLAWGASRSQDQWLDYIDFTNHTDPAGVVRNNVNLHFQDDLEILHGTIAGAAPAASTNAETRLFSLSQAALNHQESLDGLPVYIIGSLADDNLTPQKVAEIRATWAAMQPKSLLKFLQDYATSTLFHRADTVRHWNAFDRNLLVYNLNSVDNTETFQNLFNPRANMIAQGAEIFTPAHAVFGGQTSLDAATNPDLFTKVYNTVVDKPGQIARVFQSYTDTNGVNTIWRKDWAKRIPETTPGCYQVDAVGEWLWRRFVGDGGANYRRLERAYVVGFLARGMDLGYLLDPLNPDIEISSEDLLREPVSSQLASLAAECINLAATGNAARATANKRVGWAVNFISATPFMFALQGASDNTAPVASAGPDRMAFLGDAVTLDGGLSTDGEGDYLTHRWQMTLKPAGSTAVLSDTVAAHPGFAADAVGVYEFTLVVNDGKLDSNNISTVRIDVGIAPDSDADGLPDNLDPDDDNDGLTDADELNLYHTDPLILDTDGDGFDDGTEVIYQSDPLDPLGHPATGDVNNNGGVDAGDLVVCTRIMLVDVATPTFEQMLRCDVSPLGPDGVPVRDGIIDAGDILRVQQMALGR
jgi:hypothetical protein